MKFKCFYEAIVEPSAGSDLADVLKEMKALSGIIGMPVLAEFNGKKFRITSETDVDDIFKCFWMGIDTDSVN